MGAFFLLSACGRPQPPNGVLDKAATVQPIAVQAAMRVGAERMEDYLPLVAGRRVAVVTNRTGMVGGTHLVDTLRARGVQVLKVFAPEHGFRGDADAGEQVKSGTDPVTGLPVLSLYGKNKKPTPQQLADVDVVLFDIQDVGVRFYTYISTLHYVMVAAAENNKPVIVLDRPDPHGSYVDGPVLDPAYASFVGMHPVPLVHGMTVGEYARMINGEGWLDNGVRCDLHVVACVGWDHQQAYVLPVRPSPNLPNALAVALYPSLGLFEGTIVSVGRGTDGPFQCIGYPGCPTGKFRFTPRSMPGAKDPPYKDKPCTGLDLRAEGASASPVPGRINLAWLIAMYADATEPSSFFDPFFDKLAGGPALREMVVAGADEAAIRESWREGLARFKVVRERYLLYP